MDHEVLDIRIDPTDHRFIPHRARNLVRLAVVDEQHALAASGGGPATLARRRWPGTARAAS